MDSSRLSHALPVSHKFRRLFSCNEVDRHETESWALTEFKITGEIFRKSKSKYNIVFACNSVAATFGKDSNFYGHSDSFQVTRLNCECQPVNGIFENG